MKFSRLLFLIIVGVIILLPGGAVKALTIGGVDVTEVTSGDGLYSDSYETGRYVYKGANPNNYVQLGGEMWRIVAVESDGTIKLIKDDVISSSTFDTAGSRETGYCSYSSIGCNVWATTESFTNGNYTGEVSGDALVNTYLNGEYYNSLNTTVKTYIVSSTWGVGPVTINNEDLSAEIISENSVTWDGYVALISHSDYIRANSNTTSCSNDKIQAAEYLECRTTNWLYEASTFYWAISPVGNYTDYVWVICGSGVLSTYEVSESFYLRPAIHITPDIEFTGTGTEDDPYTVDQTTEDTSVQVVNVPSTAQSIPFIILAGGFGIIIVALIVIIAVTKTKKLKKKS